MKKNLFLIQLTALTFTAVLGTLLHFIYAWTKLTLFAPISAVNESTFEHMKILFFPMLFFALIQSKFFSEIYPNFWKIKCIGILIGVTLVPVLFYTYNGAFGKSPDWVNIAIFFISAGLAYFIEFLLFKKDSGKSASLILPIVILCLLTAVFIICTFFPPKIPLFQDPLSLGYGINANF